MKVTRRWLQDFVPVDCAAAELAAQLTMAGLEVESVTAAAPPFSGVVVGQVLECASHPNAEKLSVCQVTTGGSERLQIVCGASNVRAGLKVATALVGARLPDDVLIKRAKLRGLESQGMLCSARELGLGTAHEGILELDAAAQLGADLRQALDLDDSVLEVNATPNRGDCMSVFGIARDYAAAHSRTYLRYAVTPVSAANADKFPLRLQADAACPRMGLRVIRGLAADVASPVWLQERLRRVGVNCISAIVDVTNYVMLELGQPLHAYDLNKLSEYLEVRMARPRERLTLLDDKEYQLDEDCLVIADAHGAVGFAGVMGGRATAISATTTAVLLEAAHFTPGAVAGRGRRFGLFTDAAQRFERGVDPTLPAAALERATQLLLECAGGSAGPVDITVAPPLGADAMALPPCLNLRRARVARLLGVRVPDEEVREVLEAISVEVSDSPAGWQVVPPPHRFDLQIEVDLIEEVARLRGFERIPALHAVAPQVAGAASESQVDNERIAACLADHGYREVITYTFVEPSAQRRLHGSTKALALANPIAADLSEMRVSLLTGLLQVCRDNVRRQQSRVRCFEIGKKFLLTADEVRDPGTPRQDEVNGPDAVREHAVDGPDTVREIETIAGLAVGARWPEQWDGEPVAVDFFDVKQDLVDLLALTGEPVSFKAGSLDYLRPGRTARILRGATHAGWLGELHPQIQRDWNLPGPIIVFELELNSSFSCKPLLFKELSKYPSIRRDLSVVVDEAVPIAVLRENVSVSASGLLSDLRVFDVYRGPGIDSGRKSVALRLILQDSSRTLTDEDADGVVSAVVARLRDVLSATIRDQ